MSLTICMHAPQRTHVPCRPKPAPKGSPPAKPYVLAQRYCADPLLIQGRKFGIRVRLWSHEHD